MNLFNVNLVGKSLVNDVTNANVSNIDNFDNSANEININFATVDGTDVIRFELPFNQNQSGLNDKGNLSLVTKFNEISVIGLLCSDPQDCIKKGLCEIVTREKYTTETQLTELKNQSLRYCSLKENSKDMFFTVTENNEYFLYRAFACFASVSLGLYTKSKKIRNDEKKRK